MNGRIRVGRRGRRGRPFMRDARRWGIGLLAAALLGVSGPVRGQDNASDTTEAPSSGAVTGRAGGDELPTAGISPLPPPATDRAYLHVFLAFGIAWVLILGYVVLLHRRLAAAERDAGRLRGTGP